MLRVGALEHEAAHDSDDKAAISARARNSLCEESCRNHQPVRIPEASESEKGSQFPRGGVSKREVDKTKEPKGSMPAIRIKAT